MDYLLFWTAFGAIGGAIGALATASAVIVALWQVKHAEKKKLNLTFSDSMVMYEKGSSLQKCFISLSITNIGNRDVIIDKWGFDYHNKAGHALIGFNQTLLENAINPRLPHRLPIENSIDLYWERTYFKASLQEGVSKGTLNANQHLVFFACDSTGITYHVKSKKTVKEMIA